MTPKIIASLFIFLTGLVKIQSFSLLMLPIYLVSLMGLILITKEMQINRPDKATLLDAQLLEHVFLGLSGAILTWVVQIYVPLGPVFASSVLGLIMGIFIPKYSIVFYCGTFVGMASPQVFIWEFILLAGGLAGLLFHLCQKVFTGVGGKLGTLAMLGSWMTVLLLQHTLAESPELSVIYLSLGFLVSVVSGFLTFYLHTLKYTNGVVASSLAGLVSLVLGFILGSAFVVSWQILATLGFAASFVGMSTKDRIPSWGYLLLALGFSTLLFFAFGDFYPGIGGKLGFIAFVSVSGSYSVKKGLSWIKSQCTILE